ncbi:MAG: hypothetical protein HY002_05230 [Candidatus Rokubacteria bacterium]|nr:hypothetical protein [Candidatus Rokubacteria bacterium]
MGLTGCRPRPRTPCAVIVTPLLLLLAVGCAAPPVQPVSYPPLSELAPLRADVGRVTAELRALEPELDRPLEGYALLQRHPDYGSLREKLTQATAALFVGPWREAQLPLALAETLTDEEWTVFLKRLELDEAWTRALARLQSVDAKVTQLHARYQGLLKRLEFDLDTRLRQVEVESALPLLPEIRAEFAHYRATLMAMAQRRAGVLSPFPVPGDKPRSYWIEAATLAGLHRRWISAGVFPGGLHVADCTRWVARHEEAQAHDAARAAPAIPEDPTELEAIRTVLKVQGEVVTRQAEERAAQETNAVMRAIIYWGPLSGRQTVHNYGYGRVLPVSLHEMT